MKTITIRGRVTNEDFALIKAALKAHRSSEDMLHDAAMCIKEMFGEQREEAEQMGVEIDEETKIFFKWYYSIKSRLMTTTNDNERKVLK